MKKLFHNESLKKYILISIICTAVLAAAGVFSYRRHTLAPERTVEKVLENITSGIPAQTSDLDELIKQFETQYQPYFTNEAYNQAVQLRQFTAFHNQNPDFEGSINISSPEFETLDSSLGISACMEPFRLTLLLLMVPHSHRTGIFKSGWFRRTADG